MKDNYHFPLPCVAVVGPFYQSVQHVEEWFRAIAVQNYPHLKIYAVDDASNDGTLAALHHAARTSKLPVEILSHTTNRGPSAAKNLGIRQAIKDGADLVLLLDSDCRVSPDWVARHAEFHLMHADVQILGGAIQGKGHNPVGKADGYCSWLTAVPRSGFGAVKRLHLSSTNMSIKKEVFAAIGYFDEHLATGEDVAYCRKAQQAGALLWLQSDIVITHLDRNDMRSALKHHYRWGLHSFTLSTQQQGGYYGVLKKIPIPWMVTLLIPVIALLNVVLVLTKYTKHDPHVWLYLPWIARLKWSNAVGVYRGYRQPELCLID